MSAATMSRTPQKGEHFCLERLLPGECIECVGKPKHTIRIESWAGSHVVPVEVLGRTPKRVRIRFLDDCQKGKAGDVRLVDPAVVRLPAVTPRTTRTTEGK